LSKLLHEDSRNLEINLAADNTDKIRISFRVICG